MPGEYKYMYCIYEAWDSWDVSFMIYNEEHMQMRVYVDGHILIYRNAKLPRLMCILSIYSGVPL